MNDKSIKTNFCENCGVKYKVSSENPSVMCMGCAKKYASKWLITAYANFHGDLNYDEKKFDDVIEIAALMPLRHINEDPYPDVEDQTCSCKDCNNEYFANNDWPYEICMDCALKRIRQGKKNPDNDIFSFYRGYNSIPPLMNSFPGIKLDRIKDSSAENSEIKEETAGIQSHNDKNKEIIEDFEQREQSAADIDENIEF
ncbi:MAG: hypothetical protein JXQ82_05375 [Methanomicrobiaceae archaeon]|nr:hypothetical protein [Methanomicrobiaceae archaeon]